MNTPERILRIAWPGFLVACGLEMLVFGLIDPADLHWRGAPIELPRVAIYSAGFGLFWFACSCAAAISVLLSKTAEQINLPSDSVAGRVTTRVSEPR